MSDVPHMSAEEFRREAHRMVDWIADYWGRVESLPVRSAVRPGETMAKLPESAPEGAGGRGEWDAIARDLDSIVVPGLTHWQSPNFHAYFPANISGPAVLGELLSAGLGVQGMLWSTSPACTEIETRMMDWMAKAIGLSPKFLSTSGAGGGVIQGTASEAVLVAMLAAKRRVGASASAGAGGRRLVVYTSNQAHSSIIKAAMIAGIAAGPEDREGVRLIGVDENYAMDARELGRCVREDLAAGRVPCFVCATVGTTGTTAVDPLARIAAELREAEYGGWLHVDAAFAGSACICPEFRWMLEGNERADSVCFNPHKWLLTNFDCTCFWTSDKAALIGAMSITPEYLRNAASDSGGVIDYRDWQVPLGRRFRALKLWFVLRHYGLEGLREYIRGHVRLGELFEGLVRGDERFEVVSPRVLSLVCFRLKGEGPESDARNKALMERVNATGRAFVTHTVLPSGPGSAARLAGRVVLRAAIGSARVEERHVRGLWNEVSGAANQA